MNILPIINPISFNTNTSINNCYHSNQYFVEKIIFATFAVIIDFASIMALNDDFLQIGYDIIGAAYEVRNTSGRLMREIYYRRALSWELRQKGYKVENEVLIPALYKGIEIDDAYRADIVVDQRVIIEVKALGKMGEGEARQLLSYMQLSNYKLGYLINFGARVFKNGRLDDRLPYDLGIYRVVNKI